MLQPAHFNRHYYILAQFDLLPDSLHRAGMAAAGLRLFDYISDRTYLAEIQDSFSTDELKRYAVSGVLGLPPAIKLSRRLREHGQEDLQNPDKLVAVGYFGNLPEEEVRKGIEAAGAVVEPTRIKPPRVLFARVPDTAALRKLSALPYVSYLASQPMKPRVLNYNNRAVHGADALGAASGRRLFGDGVVVGVGDDSDPSSHVDFTGRLIERNPIAPAFHGTHTSGTVGGGGILNPMYQGMAPHSTIISQYFADILNNAAVYVNDYDMVLTSNSYTYYDYGCINDGEYDALAYNADALSIQYPYLLHTFASGNDGGFTCTPYPLQFATVKSGFQSAKNSLSVGNLDNFDNYIINNGSSCGPTADGRLKPELVAGGSAITSTVPNNSYAQDWGSSMSCPTVVGTMALLEQRYRQLYGGDAPAVLLKALACNTATDLGNPGPDYIFGFGGINGLSAVKSMEAGQFAFASVANGGNITANLPVPPGLAQLRVMIYWADYPAAPYSATALVNNLDLTVTDPASAVHHPLILNPAAAHVNDNAAEGVDNLNNIEQVVVNNPAGGTFSIRISGTSVPVGPQPFVLVYQFVQPTITLLYPFGGETWVPGNSEYIRWDANDGNTNTFTIDYSTDGGSTWTNINNAVPSTSRLFRWTTPNTVTNQALVRVTRNGTGAADRSSYPFVILGQPVITSVNPCQGYAQLNWNAVPSATGYDILQLIGDTMVKVGSTAGTSYLVGKLNRDSTYWLGVRAVNGSTPGRRSLSVPVIPAGTCTLPSLDNDYTVDSLIGLSSGRLYTSTQLTSTTPIRVEVKNLGTIPTGSSFTMSYSINGGAPVSEASTAVLAAGGAANYTFIQTADFSAQGTYNLKVWVGYPGDPQPGNDTLTTVIKQLGNDPIILNAAYTEGFESAAAATYSSPAYGFSGLDRCDFFASNANGRARTFVNTGLARTGNRSVTLDQAHSARVTTGDSLITTFNLSNYTGSDQVWLDFYYRNQGNDSTRGANKVWIRGNDQAAWLQAFVLDTSMNNIGVYQPSAHIDVRGLLKNATPAQAISSSFQIKFGEEGYTSANGVIPDGSLDDGYIFDDITITRGVNDIGIRDLISPDPSNICSLSAATAISIRVRNYSNANATNIPVTYSVNGTTVTETIPSINANDSIIYTFTHPADMSAYRADTITAWVHYTGDTYSNNDTLSPITLRTSPLISTYPYLEGFDTSNGNWYTGGINSSWQWGAPAKTIINKAANGPKCWVTSLTGHYNDNELSYLYSPCFDLSSLTSPVLSFSHIYRTEDNCDCDYHWAEYSTDGVNWIKLGNVGTGTNWYDNATRQAWQLSYTKWHVSSYDIPVHAPKVRFRIVMSSDPGTNYEGVGIDDVHVFDKASVYKGAADSLAQPVSGNNWINFDIGGPGHRIVAINPNGQNLGSTTVKVFFNNTGAVRFDKTQYFLDRNIVIQPARQPAGAVGVRYYFLDSEAVRLINATGCPACTTIADAYQSGVTQFSGPAAEEDSTLANDSIGKFLFHAPHTDVSIIPNDNGYYAEYQVNGFSEFWINGSRPADSAYLPVMTLSFTAVNNSGNALLQWTTTQAYGMSRYVIEKSRDSLHFSALDSLQAVGDGSGINTYQYTDNHLDTGASYYRLREVRQDGSYTYSPVRSVQGPPGGIRIYPNPVHHALIHIDTRTNTRRVRLIDVSGRPVLEQELRGTLNTLRVGNVAPGIYFLQVDTDSGSTLQKILIK